jgi:hypothetical protein
MHSLSEFPTIVYLIQFNTFIIKNLQEDQDGEALPVLTVNTASSRFFDGTRLVERLVAYLRARAPVLLVVRLEDAITHVSA